MVLIRVGYVRMVRLSAGARTGTGRATAPSGSFTAVSAGYVWHSCGIRTDGSISCWGYDRWGQLEAPRGSFTAVAAGSRHACGLRADGSIVCWGSNEWGQIDAPRGSFTAVAAGSRHACGLRADGSIVCWGGNGSGQIDTPSGKFTAVSAGRAHSCGLRDSGAVVCWGDLAFKTAGSVAAPPSLPDEGTPAEDAGVHQPSVDALAEHVPGIFDGTGCGQDLCPNEPLQRWEMAVWLVRVLDRTNPDQQTATRFDDIDKDLWWAPYAERLARLEVTEGCATQPLRFCPDKAVTRGQMATFLARALILQAGSPAGFIDTEGHTHEAGINALAAAGITAGCETDPPTYCPRRDVTRAQMATFLARALGTI